MMPSRIASGSAQNNSWWGIDVLGPLMGIRRLGGSGADQTEAVKRISKMLNCPANERANALGLTLTYDGDYTYNSNLGDDRAELLASNAGDPVAMANFAMWARFKKRVQVPSNVIIALDAATIYGSNDDRFDGIGNLITTSGTARPYPRAGFPHLKKKANVLLTDGSVRLIRAFDPTPFGVTPTTFDSTEANLPQTELREWMIRAPRLAVAGSTNTPDSAATIESYRWKKGRPLPFDTMAN
jgi:hypothetical protein